MPISFVDAYIRIALQGESNKEDRERRGVIRVDWSLQWSESPCAPWYWYMLVYLPTLGYIWVILLDQY
jgi:hypothetical protein